MRRRFLLTLITLLVITLVTGVAIFLAKGYRLSTQTGTIAGTGILSITSIPDQAQVYLDGHLTTATNANINSLEPKDYYDVVIKKEGFIDWHKKVAVKQGLVTEVKATLFRALPSVYPLTYTGADNVVLSPDAQKVAYVVPTQSRADFLTAKKSGVWVWQMSQQPISFARGAEPHQIALAPDGVDLTKAVLRWSPDSSQVLVTLPDRQLLLDASKLNDPPQDVTAVVQVTLKSWEDDQKNRDLTRLQTITDLKLRQTASAAAVLKWSPDESKILYCQSDCDFQPGTALKANYKVVDLATNQTFNMPEAAYDSWTPDSTHLVLSEILSAPQTSPGRKDSSQSLTMSKISVVEYDGNNNDEIYAGNFDPSAVIVWPDGSRIVIVSSFPTATASQPNLYGINLK